MGGERRPAQATFGDTKKLSLSKLRQKWGLLIDSVL